MGLRMADGLLRAQAMALPSAAELDPWMLLWWNRQTRLVRFALHARDATSGSTPTCRWPAATSAAWTGCSACSSRAPAVATARATSGVRAARLLLALGSAR